MALLHASSRELAIKKSFSSSTLADSSPPYHDRLRVKSLKFHERYLVHPPAISPTRPTDAGFTPPLMATPDSKAAEAGLANSPPEVGEHGPSSLATVLPLLVSPALSKFAAGVEAVIKSQASFTLQVICCASTHARPPFQSSLGTELERLNAETLRLDAAPLIPAQVVICCEGLRPASDTHRRLRPLKS
jgi:hypothetical protein